MTTSNQRGRLAFLGIALTACFLGLCVRLVDLQVFRRAEFREAARRQHHLSVLEQPQRGDIRDIKGNLLATSIPVKTVCVDPLLLTNYQREVAMVLSPMLGVSTNELLQDFRNLTRFVTNENGIHLVTNRCVVLQRNVPVETWTNIEHSMFWCYKYFCTNVLAQKQRRLNARKAERLWTSWLPGHSGARRAHLTDRDKLPLRNAWFNAVYAVDGQMRQYPNHQLAAQVLGFTTTTEEEINGCIVPQAVGVEGIEASFNDKLTGVCGWRIGRTDGHNHELVVYREQDLEPTPGLNVVLTLDARVQYLVEKEIMEVVEKHHPQGVCAIVMRPTTGEILAMANWPTFDPSDFGHSSETNRRNQAIMSAVEPGSTFKIVTVSAALNDDLVRLSDQFDCEHGRFWFAGRTLHDAESYGVLTVKQIISKSSNIGAAKIAIRMGAGRLYQYIRACGFGNRTGIPLGAESYGIVHPVEKWSKLSIARIPMGQGIAVTPLQMTLAMCMIANHGILMRPMLVDHTEDEGGHVVTQYKPTPVHRVITERTALDMITALKEVPTKEGTAVKAALEHYTVAGKTGTAQKPEPGGYSRDKFEASFIGFFPADAPELCVGVFVDEPQRRTGYYGGQVAAPAFKNISEQVAMYLDIRPDIMPEASTNNVSVAANRPPPTP